MNDANRYSGNIFCFLHKENKVQEKEKTIQSHKSSIRLHFDYFVFLLAREKPHGQKRTDGKENEITIKNEIEKSR